MALLRISDISKEEAEKLLGGSLVFSLPTLGRPLNRQGTPPAKTPEPSASESTSSSESSTTS